MKKSIAKQDQKSDEFHMFRESQQLQQLLLDNVHDIIAIHRLSDLRYEYVNPAALRIFGFSREELFQQSALELIHPDDMGRVMLKMKANLPGGEGQDEFRYRTKDGSYVWLQVTGIIASPETGEAALIIIARDITQQKQAEAALQLQSAAPELCQSECARIDRDLKVTRAVMDAIIRAEKEEELLPLVCQKLQEAGGYPLNWVGYVREDQGMKVKPVAHAGRDSGYLAKLNINLHDPKRGWGPTGISVRTGKPVTLNNLKSDENFEPWLKNALRRGFKSSMAIPLMADDKTFGVLNIYADQIDAFDQAEQRLLMEVGDMVAYAIISLRARAGQPSR